MLKNAEIRVYKDKAIERFKKFLQVLLRLKLWLFLHPKDKRLDVRF